MAAGLGPREPTGPGTATVARMAMSATLATTLGVARRGGRYHGSADPADFDAGRDQIGTVSASVPMPSRTYRARRPARPPPHARAALARAGRPDDPARDGTCLARDADRATARPRVALAHVGRRACAPRRGARAPTAPWRRSPTCWRSHVDAGTLPAGHPLIDDLARRFPGVRIPRTRARSSSRSSRRSSSRRSPARRRGARGSG